MDTSHSCLCCGRPAQWYQKTVGTNAANRDIVSNSVYACDVCKDELQRAAADLRKRNWAILSLWVTCLGLSIFYLPVLGHILFPLAPFLLGAAIWISNNLFSPEILKSAQRHIEEGNVASVTFSELGEKWRKTGSAAQSAGCSRCGYSVVTHEFEIEGSSYTASEGVIQKTDIYATQKISVPLCEYCAIDLTVCLYRARWLKIFGALTIAAVVVGYCAKYLGYALSWNLLQSMVIPFLFVVVIAYQLMIVISYYALEYPWVNRTEARNYLGVEGFDRSVVKIKTGPIRKELEKKI
jgi:hypothetical protein